MRKKTIVLVCLAGAVLLASAYEYSWAKAESEADTTGVKIGIVSIRKIFEGCQRNIGYRKQAEAEQNKFICLYIYSLLPFCASLLNGLECWNQLF